MSAPARDARQGELMQLAAALRPELHRYCARLTGSVIDGEDIVQDTFERALGASEQWHAQHSGRAWLFRIAHNRALDFLRSRSIRQTEPIEAAVDVPDLENPDPAEQLIRKETLNSALSRFLDLPTTQRGVVILKDVLGHSLEEIAASLGLSVNAVKAHLARGRARLRTSNGHAASLTAQPFHSPSVERYAQLFNARDWNALRAMLADDVRLVQSAYPPRSGAGEVAMFFGIYSRSQPVRLVPAWLEGREVLGVFNEAIGAKPAYFMWLQWVDGRIQFIRDYRHLPYIMTDAELLLH